MSTNSDTAPFLAGLSDRLPGLRTLYEDLHAHPELSFAEFRTAGIVAAHLRERDWQITEGVGGTHVGGAAASHR
ncbi:hypothetical protein BIV57_01970 [Mangrovactinospora gilvigrisea]|uniref:Amidohydrolase n=1 Tax=Mangrovactinospora gilvigrisea TaxID=1428644 RepID=A0A1J7BKK7_9ACTN|nr:hypothetical protein BIV57_01970 [Mangrovactinospora gilvigrisea]